MAEGEGFEPSVRYYPYGCLANSWFQPTHPPLQQFNANKNQKEWNTSIYPQPATAPTKNQEPKFYSLTFVNDFKRQYALMIRYLFLILINYYFTHNFFLHF